MIDLHTHTILSDGELCPAELAQRAKEKGYKALGITDHVDPSNIDSVVSQIVRFCQEVNRLKEGIDLIPGVELTHCPPALIAELADRARKKGARIILVHGETIVEPVEKGTNRAALKADIDILAHPGLISEDEVKLARQRGIFLEISSRKGHCLSNGWVARLCLKYGAKLILNTDTHSPSDLITIDEARKVLQGAGLSPASIETVFSNSRELVSKVSSRRERAGVVE